MKSLRQAASLPSLRLQEKVPQDRTSQTPPPEPFLVEPLIERPAQKPVEVVSETIEPTPELVVPPTSPPVVEEKTEVKVETNAEIKPPLPYKVAGSIEELKKKAKVLSEPKPEPKPEPKVQIKVEPKIDVIETNNRTEKTMLQKILSNVKGMLADSNDAEYLSSKRVVAVLAFICCVVAFFVDLFSNYNISPNLFDAMMWIVIAGLGFTGLEKFAPKK